MQNLEPIYKQILKRYQFSIPREYRQMNENGWFDFDDGRNRVAPTYLWLYDMEWLDPSQIRDHQFPEFCKPDFVPFAFTGGGDHWCWYPAETADGKTPVVLCPHDSNIGQFYAPDFLSGLYRHMLDFASDDHDDEKESRGHLHRWHDLFSPIFPPRWTETLASLAVAPVQSWEVGTKHRFKHFGLLPADNYETIVHRGLGFPKLNTAFKWMVD